MPTKNHSKYAVRAVFLLASNNIIARASFETPLKHIINAATIGETDHLNSVIENVMLNQPVPVGTGLPRLKMKTKK